MAEKHRLAIKQDHNVKGIVLKKGHGQKRRQVVIAHVSFLGINIKIEISTHMILLRNYMSIAAYSSVIRMIIFFIYYALAH